MDKNSIILKLNKALPGAILETRRFGRSGVTSIWVESQCLCKVGLFLKDESSLRLDWLENLSIVEFENVLVATYFLRSTVTDLVVFLRTSAVPKSPEAWMEFPSVRSVWSTARPLEEEVQEMFGILFKLESGEVCSEGERKLPQGWAGFPLRKSYIFPISFMGLEHSRSVISPQFKGLPKKIES